jgi:hypothetical protein
MALKTIIVAHNDALTAAKSEVDVEKAIMLYLKNMLDDGYIMIPMDSEAVFDEPEAGNS